VCIRFVVIHDLSTSRAADRFPGCEPSHPERKVPLLWTSRDFSIANSRSIHHGFDIRIRITNSPHGPVSTNDFRFNMNDDPCPHFLSPRSPTHSLPWLTAVPRKYRLFLSAYFNGLNQITVMPTFEFRQN
jgi:hypothetical protein